MGLYLLLLIIYKALYLKTIKHIALQRNIKPSYFYNDTYSLIAPFALLYFYTRQQQQQQQQKKAIKFL
jgi:hypothetical protein